MKEASGFHLPGDVILTPTGKSDIHIDFSSGE